MELYIARGGQRLGPFPLDEVKQKIESGELSPSDLAWTEGGADWIPLRAYLSPTLPPPVPAPPVPQVVYQIQKGPAPGNAIASLICGIATFVVPILPAIPAIVCGHLALNEINNSQPPRSGTGMAVTGLILGYFSAVMMALMLVMLMFFGITISSLLGAAFLNPEQFFSKAKITVSTPTVTLSRPNLVQDPLFTEGRKLLAACQDYAKEHEGNFPPRLEDVPTSDPDLEKFLREERAHYIYFGGKASDPADQVLLRTKVRDSKNRHVVLRVGGKLGFETEESNPAVEK